MLGFWSSALALLTSLHGALALPAAQSRVSPRTVTTLTAAQLAGYADYTELARAAYCAPTSIEKWSCGQACSAVLGFNVSLAGGDGSGVQYYYVGSWPEKQTVTVAHQGTDPTQFLSLLTDANIIQSNLNATLFPGAPSSAYVHSGFAAAHGDTGSSILAEVQRLLKVTGYSSVTTVGHSLGGAIAQLDALMFRLNLPASVSVTSVTYGTPRVGNPAYAQFFDSKLLGSFTRIDHADDPIPTVPGRFLGFQHPSGEVHMIAPGHAVACPGEDDATDSQCQIESVPNIFESDIIDHLGPYEGDVWIGTPFCT